MAANEIRRLQRSAVPTANVAVDEDGVGGGVVDLLRCVGFVNNSRAVDENFRQPEKSMLLQDGRFNK